MCDYSLHSVASRPARVSDALVSKSFPGTLTRGFASVDQPTVAVCVLPGTEIAFEKEVRWSRPFWELFQRAPSSGKVVRFRQVNVDRPNMHHDAIEFPNGKIVLLTALRQGQKAVVLQLPATSQPPLVMATYSRQTGC
jgi:hypothetical protein